MPDGKKLILVVDDEPDARDFFITVLEDNGYDTVFARDGNEAMARLAEGLPDLVTLDITMPEKSGVGVYRGIKEDEKYKDIPVIIITGVADDFKQFISTRRQVPPPDGYLSKPVEPDQLLGKVRALLA
jgi:CheY-like chemotaxis protein